MNFTTIAGTRTSAGSLFFEVSPGAMVLSGHHPAMRGNDEKSFRNRGLRQRFG
jgi:hypothetical protein